MANCPACKHVSLVMTNIEDGLPVLTCSVCHGSWLRANEYARWLKSQSPGTFAEDQTKDASERFAIVESNKAITCPDCGRFLRKYRIGATVDFHIDRCNHCNGVWLEANEWQALKAGDLHDEVNQFFTKPWQDSIQSKATAATLDAIYLQRFGATDYQKIRQMRDWLKEHPNRNMLIAFMLDQDPYAV